MPRRSDNSEEAKMQRQVAKNTAKVLRSSVQKAVDRRDSQDPPPRRTNG